VAKSRKVSVVDGYTALKAAQHAVKPKARVEPAQLSPLKSGDSEQPSELQKLGAHVTRTAVPAKQLIECYECGYKFQLHGKAATTNCSKCRATLELANHTIDRKWNGPLKTAGTIHITADGIVETGDLIANDIILEGAIEAGTVRAMRTLELRSGARFSEHNIKAPDLVIAPGGTVALLEPAEYRDIEIAGTLRAHLHATGVVCVRSSGCFEGKLLTAHLSIEDGGGLIATVEIR